jgi:hypothetical protein
MRRLILACALAAAPASAQEVRDALAVGDLVCEFGEGARRSLTADLANKPRSSDLLLVYEMISAESAQVLSTSAPGRRPVLVRATDKAVHFIERLGPSVRVTTLTGCERRKLRRGTQTCVRYTARYAWHFDERAVSDPDRAFAELPADIMAGRCEPWRLD